LIAATRSWTFSSRSLSPGSGCVPFLLVTSSLLPTDRSPQYSFAEQGFDPFVFVNGSSSTSRISSPTHPPVHPPPVTVPVDSMGHAFDLRLPAIALSASLAYFARLDMFPLEPPHSRRIDGLTVEDIEHYNSSFRTRTVPRGPGSPGDPSTRHDWDWLRGVAGDPFMSGSIRRYTPGILTGKWRGTELVRLLRALNAPILTVP